MKRCPKCSRTYPDDNQKFCTVDGGLLVAGDKPFDPNATIQGSANMSIPTAPPPAQPVSNRPPDLNETIGSSPTAVLPRKTGSTGFPTSADIPNIPPPPPPSAPPPPPKSSAPSASPPRQQAAPPQSPSAPLPPAQRGPALAAAGVPPVAKKKSKLLLILGILAIL